MVQANDAGRRLQTLRKRCGLSIRRLGELAGVTAGMISCLERGKNSPSLATLQKILNALGSDLSTFFGAGRPDMEGPVFPREGMRLVSDAERSYTIVFPKRADIAVEMLDEHLLPCRHKPPFETLQCDVGGCVLTGLLALEIAGRPHRVARPGDAFYIPKGTKHRGYAIGGEAVRIMTVYSPAKY